MKYQERGTPWTGRRSITGQGLLQSQTIEHIQVLYMSLSTEDQEEIHQHNKTLSGLTGFDFKRAKNRCIHRECPPAGSLTVGAKAPLTYC